MSKFDERHGGPYDRGRADSWYGRGFRPHYYAGGTYDSPAITELTVEEHAAYYAGFYDNEADPSMRKVWD